MVFSSLHKKKALFLAVLLIVFTAFSAEFLSVRKELRHLSCQENVIDDDAMVAIVNNAVFYTAPTVIVGSVYRESSVEISFLYLLPYAFRAPPPSVPA
jgi:hypothetical protein